MAKFDATQIALAFSTAPEGAAIWQQRLLWQFTISDQIEAIFLYFSLWLLAVKLTIEDVIKIVVAEYWLTAICVYWGSEDVWQKIKTQIK